MNDKKILARLSGVVKRYQSSNETLTILNSLDAEFYEGSTVAITGRSGCGKSTLINIIGGLDAPTAGSVRVGDYSLDKLGEDDLTQYRARFLGLVFQFHYLLKDFTALENVMLPAYMRGIPRKEALDRARALLRDVNLENRANHLPSQLSGGERQRAAVARALVCDPRLVLADEPTGNLDPANSELAARTLFSIVESYKKTLIVVTHDSALARRANVRLRLTGGKLIALGEDDDF